MQSVQKTEVTHDPQPQLLKCAICGKPTTRLVDGEPSCDYHANQVYEHQIEDYTRKQQG